MARASGVYGAGDVARRLRASALHDTEIARSRKAALIPTLDAAKAHVIASGSVHRGVLLDGLVIVDKGRNASAVTATGQAVRIAHLVEFGTRPHWQPRRHVHHPGARPKPYMRPAFEETRGEVVAVFGQEMLARITLSLRS